MVEPGIVAFPSTASDTLKPMPTKSNKIAKKPTVGRNSEQILWFFAFTAIISTILILMAYRISGHVYQTDIEHSKEELVTITRLLSRNAELRFNAVDMTLSRIKERQHFNLLFGGNLKQDLKHHIKQWMKQAPHIHAILLLDEEARISALISDGKKKMGVGIGDKYLINGDFTRHRADESTDLLISAHEDGGSDWYHLINFSRRLEKIDGTFGGVAIAIVDGHFLTDFFKKLNKNRRMQYGLIDQNGRLLINDSGVEPNMGVLKFVERHAVEVDEDPTASVKLAEKKINNKFNLFAFKSLAHMPISTAVVMFDNDIFLGWKEGTRNFLIFLAIFVILLGVVAFFVLRLLAHMRKVQRSEMRAVVASRAKTEFLAKMSHELRTPLNAIIGFADMLTSGDYGYVTKPQKERLRDIDLCAGHLLELIDDILEYSKGEKGKLELFETDVDMHSVVEKAMRIVGPKAEVAGISLKNLIEDPPLLKGDSRKLQQVLLNLLTNAIKYNNAGGAVSISDRYDRWGNYLVVVEDNGIGMDKKEIPKAMSLFERIDTKQEGAGLGLPLCKMFMELHGGKIHIASKKGVGTKVFVSIPKSRLIKGRYRRRLFA